MRSNDWRNKSELLDGESDFHTSSSMRVTSAQRVISGERSAQRTRGAFTTGAPSESAFEDDEAFARPTLKREAVTNTSDRSTRQVRALQPHAEANTSQERDMALATRRTAPQMPVTIVPATQSLPVIGPMGANTVSGQMRRRKRRVIAVAASWTLGLTVVLAVLAVATPVTRQALAQQFANAQNSTSARAPWSNSAGAVPVLGLGGGAAPGYSAPGSAGIPVQITKTKATPPPTTYQPPSSGILPAPFSPWPPSDPFMAVPGHPSFGMSPNGYYNSDFGQCTWWAQYERKDENLTGMGNAMYWPSSARARGYRVGYVPSDGATVVFQPGVQGAGGVGHVAHVVALYPDGWFLISEMNFYSVSGGGWGRVDYRYAHTGYGVSFIY